ncbi:MAG TPA: carboxypeptidase-like regulatory domain-containing protein [Thermoanaerobaculia bacterium]|nr:carboxypeptidase-like regulatory domain-containing protein [Thermoanaerobaculia bacterium]
MTARIPGETSMELGEGRWEVSLEAAGWWAAKKLTGGEAVTIDAWPAGSVHARIRARRAPASPVRMQFTPPIESDSAAPSGVAECVVVKDECTCELPVGTHDLKIGARGWAPVFQWNVVVVRGKMTQLAPIEFREGASVLGRIALSRDVRIPMKRLRVGLMPVGGAMKSALYATVDERGRFSFVGVPRGDYTLQAAAPSLSSEIRTVRAIEGLVAELDRPLIVGPPHKITVTIDPDVTPENVPWRVRLLSARSGDSGRDARRQLDQVTESSADADGTWLADRLHDGHYVVQITSANGDSWHEAEITIDGDDVRELVSIPLTHVTGTVHLGDRPLAAKLTFGGEYGAIRRQLTADENGEFAGEFPQSQSDEWTVHIASDAPPVDHHVRVTGVRKEDGSLQFDITIPRTLLTGSVVQENGTPERYPIVHVTNADSSVREHISGRADGTFDVIGLAPGTYRVFAEGFLSESERAEVVVGEEDTPSIRLVMKNSLQIPGRVVVGGAPVIGASVDAIARPFQGAHDHRQTNESGAFLLVFPRGTEAIDIVVKAPGLPLTLRRAELKTLRRVDVAIDPRGGALTLDVPRTTQAVSISHQGATTSFGIAVVTHLDSDAVVSDAGEERVWITFPRVEPGDYTLCVEEQCVSGFVVPAGSATLTIR